MPPQMITLTCFEDVNRPETGRVLIQEWSNFTSRWKHQRGPKAGLCISPVVFRENYRVTRNAVHRHGLFLDIEQLQEQFNAKTGEQTRPLGPKPPSASEAAELFRKAGYAVAIATTYHHTPDNPRFRTATPYLEPLEYPEDPEERVDAIEAERAAIQLFIEHIGLSACVDPSKLKPDAAYYMPRTADLATAEVQIVEGRPLDILEWLPAGKEIVAKHRRQQAERARAAAEIAEIRRQQRLANGNDVSLLDEVRGRLPALETVLQEAGYDYFPRAKRWLYPGSSSGVPGVLLLTGQDGIVRYVSHHASDPLSISSPVFGTKAHDIVDFVIFQPFGGSADFRESLRILAAEMGILDRRDSERKRLEQQRPAPDVSAEDFERPPLGNPEHVSSEESGQHREARRDRQREENIKIGEALQLDPLPEILTLEEAEERFVFVSVGSRVSDTANPTLDITLADFAAKMAASRVNVTQQKTDQHGQNRTLVIPKPLVAAWRESPRRKTVTTRTFRPDAEVFCVDPDGSLAFNVWRPRQRPEADPAEAVPFVEHIEYVFGSEAEAFLDWLAHIEQAPGVLPHTAWLSIATQTGIGRNLIASVLTRLWRGNVAASVDLPALIEGGYNGRLSSKCLAIVDEIREGGLSQDRWRFSERLKSVITEETRLINPKYGRQSVEFNCCRWLLFSNHTSALRLAETDRRFNVSICSQGPRSEEYYTRLYTLLYKPRFINAVAAMLAQRDISGFNPGARAIRNEAKAEVVESGKTEAQMAAEAVRDYWPADIIPSNILAAIITGGRQGALSGASKYAVEDAGMRAYKFPVRIEGKSVRVTIVRNVEHWAQRKGSDLALEICGKTPEVVAGGSAFTDWHEWLEARIAEGAEPAGPTVYAQDIF